MSRLQSPRFWLVLFGAVAVLTVVCAVVVVGAVAGVDRGIESFLLAALATLGGAGWLKAYLQQGRALRAEQALTAARQASVAAALRDPLTGLANQRLFDSHLRAAFERGQRYGNSFSVLLIELDFAGSPERPAQSASKERVLKYLGTIFTRNLRSADTAARVSDYSFGVLLPETEYEGARHAWERIRDVSHLNWPDNRTWSLSGGAAGYNVDVGSVENMLSDADRRLALEKRRLRAEHES